MEICLQFVCTVGCSKIIHTARRGIIYPCTVQNIHHIDKYFRVRARYQAISSRHLTAETGV